MKTHLILFFFASEEATLMKAYDQVSVSGPSLRTNAEKNIKELKERVMTDINVSKVA